jgi:KUP system potassium uptake protein
MAGIPLNGEPAAGPAEDDGDPAPPEAGRPGRAPGSVAALTLGALGVVFGDIGTSPLYALNTVFHADHGAVPATPSVVYGVISLVFWALVIVVTIKVVTFLMRADNDGEGGIMALIALTERAKLTHRTAKVALVSLGIFGAALFYGDGMITPAISVLSAVEGLEVAAPSIASLVVPITLTIVTVLFGIQRFGTGAVGRLFGPVMAVWFLTLAVGGVLKLVERPEVLKALSPTYAAEFFGDHGGVAFIALGSVVLAVTGAEALYADMGHFGRKPINRSWLFVAFPALVLNYLGQAALIVGQPKSIQNPFFLLYPGWSRIPLVILATVAAVIASQAVISGAFSVTHQAVNLGFLPRLKIHHTSAREEGQVYEPVVNWSLFAAIVGLVIGFGSSAGLAAAYGIAVTGTLAIDTILFFVVVRVLWKRPLWMVLAGGAAFLTVDLAFLTANLPKVVHGGWFPLLVAAIIYLVLTTWQKGREILTRRRREEEGSLGSFVEELRAKDPPVHRPPRTAVFLNATRDTTPLAMRVNVEHNDSLHRTVVVLWVETLRVPHVPVTDQVHVDDLGSPDDGISHITVRVGFQDRPDVPRIVRLAGEDVLEDDVDLDQISYFLSRMSIVLTDAPGMSRWRKRLFMAVARNSTTPGSDFRLPEDQTVVMGSYVKL